MIKTKNISDFKIGQNIYGFFQITLKEKNISKNGDYYIDLFLRDRTGIINGKIWDFISFYDKAFSEGDIVAIKGIVKRYREKLFLEINNITLLDPNRYKKYGFNHSDIHPELTIATNSIFNKIKKVIFSLDPPYKNILLDIYERYEQKIKSYPDDLDMNHYNKKGSLLLKIYNALEIANKNYKSHIIEHKNIILSGILLKYIGRIKQYDYNIVFKLSDIGQTENCFILSRDILKEYSAKFKKNEQVFINQLVDIILYNHESKEITVKNASGAIVYTIFQLEKALTISTLYKN